MGSVYSNITRNLSVIKPLLLKELLSFKDVFFIKEAGKLPSYIEYNYIIEITAELLYRLLYNLFNTELAILKAYLNKTLAKGQIKYFINFTGSPILFVFKKNKGLRLYVNYRGLNKITVKNRYPLSLINKILNRLYKIKLFIKLNFKDTYYYIRIKLSDK